MNLSSYSTAGFSRGAPKWKEALWILVRSIFFLPSLPVPSSVRTAWLRLFGARVGTGVIIRSRVNITFPWRLEIGNYAWIGEEVLILSLARVRIGSDVCISQRAFLCTGSHAFQQEDFALIARPIHVSSGSWIAAQAFIGPGVEVGSGAVVSAGAVVLDNVSPRTLVQGNPARAIKQISRAPLSDRAERPCRTGKRNLLFGDNDQ